jgi:hypothetical protein
MEPQLTLAGNELSTLTSSSPTPGAGIAGHGTGTKSRSDGVVISWSRRRWWSFVPAGYPRGVNDVEQVPRLRPEVTVTLTVTR